MPLDELRRRIDELDGQLVHLLNERTRLALEIGQLKQQNGEQVYVPGREQEVLDRVAGLNQGPLTKQAVAAIYREIMSASKALARAIRVAYLGPPATFSHQAARSRFGGSVEYVDCAAIRDIFVAIEKGQADYGVVPVENTTEGAIAHTLDEFLTTSLKVCAEILLPVSHHLMAAGPAAGIRRIYSNPYVFGQCRRWLMEKMPGIEQVPVSSTGRAAELAAREPGSAALAGLLAAELYGLPLVEENVQDMSSNATRFLVLAKAYGGPTGRDKTSIAFAVENRMGALYEALEAFKRHGINMTKIESRPSRAKAWEYVFFVDFEGHAAEPAIQAGLAEFARHCLFMTVLGSYPRAAEDV
jgi:chorismate mutase/prephenate dehydratase